MTLNFSRQGFTNHVRSKGVLERHVTRMPSSFLALCRFACVRVVWEMCFGLKNTANVVENILFWLSKNWEKAQRCRNVSLVSLTLRSAFEDRHITIANVCFVLRSETPDEIHTTKR